MTGIQNLMSWSYGQCFVNSPSYRIARLFLAAVLAGAAMLFANPLCAQLAETPVGGQAAATIRDAVPGATLAEVEAALAAIEADAGMEDAVKDQLRPKYTLAIAALKEAADFDVKAAEYREAIQKAPERAAALRAELKALSSADSAAMVTAPDTTEDVRKDIDSRQATLNGWKDDLAKGTSELANAKGRPAEISARLPKVQRDLSDIREQLASPEFAQDVTSPNRVAERILLQAEQSRLLSELEILKQEQLSQSVREDLLEAQQDLLTRQIENAAAALETLQASLRQRLRSKVERVRSLAGTLPRDIPEDDVAAQDLAASVRALAKEFGDVVVNLEKVTIAQNDLMARDENLTRTYESVQEYLKLGASGRAMVEILFDLDQKALNARADVLRVPLPALDGTRLAALHVEEELRRQPDVEEQFADHSSDAVARLVTTRREVLENLRTTYGDLTRKLAELIGRQDQYLDKAKEVRAFIRKQFFGFGLRSCPPISSKTVADLPGGLRWVFRGEHWAEIGRALQGIAKRMPARSIGIVLVAVVLVLMRRRIGAALEGTGVKIRRIATDRYAHTGAALLCTFLLAFPIPLLIGSAAWSLGQTPNPSDWMRGVTDGLWYATWISFVAGFLVAVCRPGGLGDAHFGWREETLAQLWRAVRRFTMVFIPAILLMMSCAYGVGLDYLHSVARISFMLAWAWATFVAWQLFHGSDGILATLAHAYPGHMTTRWRYLWSSLVLACPIAFLVFAGLGYLITALQLSLGLLVTVALIAGGVILYGFVLRWFTMKHRKLALAEALERRRARQEAAAAENEEEPTGEIVTVDPEDEEELDLESISDQTRALLRLLFFLGVAVAILGFWSGTFPLIHAVDSVPIPLTNGLTLLGLVQAILIAIVTYIAVRNLPGLLELAVLRATTIDAGTRHAISTLCQYSVTAIGVTLLFNVLRVDWARFGWIVAALSVGLGFGLQEVVANFVCGLILLFERPIRVGDIVTIEGMTGTVTRIQMRATTITNWDRQEFVVPNKSFITGTILNWTLSAPLNRVVIPVGVAYGSDTDRARQILLDVAADHPRVLDDPAPRAAFEQFADSSLNLGLRAFLPDLENRVGVITELHTEIHKRFAAAGIEIAFPQQDLHIRSGWDGSRGATSDGDEDGRRDAASGRTHEPS